MPWRPPGRRGRHARPDQHTMQLYYRYVLALSTEAGEALGEFPVAPDWGPAREAVSLLALRSGADTPLAATAVAFAPVWNSERGAPYLTGARAACGAHEALVPIRYFRALAQHQASQLVAEHKLEDGARYTYEVLAYPVRSAAETSSRFQTEEVLQPLPFRDAAVSLMIAEATSVDAPAPEDFPVLIEPEVMAEAEAQTRRVSGVETGGVLIGHLLRDKATRDLAVHLTAQIPAAHAPATAAKLSFTAETWAAARSAIALRGRGELMLGTWHSHPAVAWCAKCPLERQRACGLRLPFFSEDDALLHRTVFSRAYCVALVVSEAFDGLRHGLFGWRGGLIEARGFHRTGAVNTNTEPEHVPLLSAHS